MIRPVLLTLLFAALLIPVRAVALESTTTRRAKRTYMGREIAQTMSAAGAEWLIRNTRQTEEQPQRLLASLDLLPGQHVCDFGCGNGFYTLKLAARVQPHGKIYAVDIQPEMLDLLQQRAEPRGFRNIEPILASTTETNLPSKKLDLVLMVDVYHELSRPGKVLQSVRQSLKPRGRLAIVEFRAEDPAVPIKPLHKMTQAQVMKEISANGFQLVGQYDQLPWQHVLLFSRDDSPLAPQTLRLWKPTRAVGLPKPRPSTELHRENR